MHFEDMIKCLEMGGYPGLSGWDQCNHKYPYKSRAGGSESAKENGMIKAKGWSGVIQGRGHESRNAGGL